MPPYLSFLSSKGRLAALLASAAILTTGCANMATTATPSVVTSAAALSGHVKGGNQPIQFATVQLYAAGVSGIGAGNTLLATTMTDQTSHFAFTQASGGTYSNTGNTYVCPNVTSPSTPDVQLYLLVKGGNTLGSAPVGSTAGTNTINNSAAVFLAPLGYCNSVSSATFVEVTEATTVAAVAALAQFINPSTEGIGNDGIAVAYQALNNAFTTIPVLVSPSTGLANTTVVQSGANATGGVNVGSVSITATPETAKINTIANILASCINQQTATSGSACTTLFANAVPPANLSTTSQPGSTFPAATDTLQAALYMFLNPTDSSPTHLNNLFSLQTANPPYQPALSSNQVPTDWTLGVSYTSSGACTGGSSFINVPKDFGFDSTGHVWFPSQGELAEMSPAGVPMTCVNYSGNTTSGGVIDIAGNVWYASSSSNVIDRYSPSGNSSLVYTTAAPVVALTTDGAGDIFFSTVTGSTGTVYEIGGGSSTQIASSPVAISTTVGPNPVHMFPDSANDIWVTSGSGYISELVQTTGSATGYVTNQFTVTSPSYGITVGHSNAIYVVSQDYLSTLTALTPVTGSTGGYTQAYTATSHTGGLNLPSSIAIDGAQNSWASNLAAASTSGNYGVAEVSSTGTALSPTGTNGGYQKSSSFLSVSRVLRVDSAGNVWVANDENPNSITEFVGSAVPIFQPFSVGAQLSTQGRFQSIP